MGCDIGKIQYVPSIVIWFWVDQFGFMEVKHNKHMKKPWISYHIFWVAYLSIDVSMSHGWCPNRLKVPPDGSKSNRSWSKSMGKLDQHSKITTEITISLHIGIHRSQTGDVNILYKASLTFFNHIFPSFVSDAPKTHHQLPESLSISQAYNGFASSPSGTRAEKTCLEPALKCHICGLGFSRFDVTLTKAIHQ